MNSSRHWEHPRYLLTPFPRVSVSCKSLPLYGFCIESYLHDEWCIEQNHWPWFDHYAISAEVGKRHNLRIVLRIEYQPPQSLIDAYFTCINDLWRPLVGFLARFKKLFHSKEVGPGKTTYVCHSPFNAWCKLMIPMTQMVYLCKTRLYDGLYKQPSSYKTIYWYNSQVIK